MIVRSAKYLAGSRDAPCTLRIVGVCEDERDTSVPNHLRDRHTGRGGKASDLSVADGCGRCHDVLDRRARLPDGSLISEADWNFYALRGLQETLERRVELKLLTVAGFDVDAPRRERPTPARKPAAQRKKVPQGRGLESRSSWPEGRKLDTRPLRQKEKI